MLLWNGCDYAGIERVGSRFALGNAEARVPT
jgi:hypothetical protein